jgi:hypothetical protein
MQCACAILSSVVCPALQYSFILFHNVTIFEKNSYWTQKSVFWFSLKRFSETFLILRRNERDTKNVCWSSCKVPFILVRFQWNLKFLDKVSKNPQVLNFMKIPLVGAKFHGVDGRTDRHDVANSRFSQFSESSKLCKPGSDVTGCHESLSHIKRLVERRAINSYSAVNTRCL